MGFFKRTSSGQMTPPQQSTPSQHPGNTRLPLKTTEYGYGAVAPSRAMAGVYGWMSLGVLLSALVGFGLIQSGFIFGMLQMGMGIAIVVLLAQVALVFAMSFAAHRMPSNTLKGLFLLYSAITGFTFAIIMLAYPIGNVVALFFVAAIGFAALALLGATTKKDLSFMGTFLIMGLFMIIGASIVNIFAKSALLESFAGWAGILVFSGLTAYDSQRLRNESMALTLQGEDAKTALGRFTILGALTMYLNFINLFISLLRVFGGERRD